MSDAAVYRGRAAVRAGILVTGTEVLTGIISDRNGPWLSERLRELGVDAAGILVVGDRPDDLMAGLRHFAAEGVRLIVTSGGLGPTADDLTAEIVGEFCGREMVLDAALEERIAAIIARISRRFRGVDPEAVREANRKQAIVPSGATVLEPVGTAPGLVVEPAGGSGGSVGSGGSGASGGSDASGGSGGSGGGAGPVVVVLPGPPGELQQMWSAAVESQLFQEAVAGAPVLSVEMLRLWGIPEAEISTTLREAAAAGVELSALEITTCLRRGEIEVSVRYGPGEAEDFAALKAFILERHGDVVFAPAGETIDQLVADGLGSAGLSVAVAESCTGGMLAARLTDLPGSSAYFPGGVVAYGNDAKSALVDVPASMIASVGAVSAEVALALADGARGRFGSSFGVGITGVAGPGGGTEEKPVGTVWFAVSSDSRTKVRHVLMPGSRSAIRERSTTVAMHLLWDVIQGGGEPR